MTAPLILLGAAIAFRALIAIPFLYVRLIDWVIAELEKTYGGDA